MKRWHLLALASLCASCGTTPRTEVVLLVTTDYSVPTELDAFTATVAAPDMEIQTASATLTGPEDLPRSLGLVHRAGPLGTFDVTVDGTLADSVVATRRARFSFQEGRTLVLRIHLSPACEAVRCVGDETCEGGACRPIRVAPDELQPWPPADSGVMDATPSDVGADAPTGDSSLPDGGPDTIAPTDATGDAPTPSCDDLFSELRDYNLCEERPGECEFYSAETLNPSCRAVCDASDQVCVAAYVPGGPMGRARCTQSATLPCDEMADSVLCVCSRAGP